MGSFLFKWDHPATEVYVTGTFDDWAKSVKLEKKEGTRFEKLVDLPRADEKYYYKFVVDENWTTDHTAPQETDHANNTNNVLLPEYITKHSSSSSAPGFASMSSVTPASTTAGLAANVPKETANDGGSSDLPGAFPETPAAENQSFSVAPIPATSSIGNPVRTTPGEAVPPPSEFTQNTITSAVTHDKASYEQASSAPPVLPDVVTPEAEREANGAGLFGLPPTSSNMIPESSLPLGGSKPSDDDTGVTIQSAGPTSTTAALAGAVPLEPRGVPESTVPEGGVPEIVQESQAEAGFDPEASANPEAVHEKSEVEKELESKVPEEPATSDGSNVPALSDLASSATGYASGGISTLTSHASNLTAGAADYANGGISTLTDHASNLTAGAAGLAAGATAVVAGAAAYATGGKVGAPSTKPTAIAATVPDVVQESIAESHQSPEAAASTEMVKEKSEVEAQLLKQVKHEDSQGEPAPTTSAATTETAPAAPTKTTPPALLKSTEEPLTASTPTNPADAALAVPSTPAAASDQKSIDSRDVSPMTRGDGKSVAPQPTIESMSASTSTPTKATAASTTSTPASATGSKKSHRISGFFGKLKGKLSDKDKDKTSSS